MNCSKCKGLGRIYMGCGSWVHCDACNTTGRREWHGLTDEEIMDACDSTGWSMTKGIAVDIARAIEAKLKEKNS